MQVEVIEFELTCPEHGTDRMIVPVQFPRPAACRHCFARLTERREVRRFTVDPPFPASVSAGSEAWIG